MIGGGDRWGYTIWYIVGPLTLDIVDIHEIINEPIIGRLRKTSRDLHKYGVIFVILYPSY